MPNGTNLDRPVTSTGRQTNARIVSIRKENIFQSQPTSSLHYSLRVETEFTKSARPYNVKIRASRTVNYIAFDLVVVMLCVCLYVCLHVSVLVRVCCVGFELITHAVEKLNVCVIAVWMR